MRDDLVRFLRDELGTDMGPAADSWTLTTPLWLWRGNPDGPLPKAAWYFLTVAGAPAEAIRAAAKGRAKGFGSVRVAALIGATPWTTSLFPAREFGGYLLPVKAAVRRREGLAADAPVTVMLTIATD